MQLSELYAQIQAAGDVLSYAVLLATPDTDGEDVDLAGVGAVEVHTDTGEVRLYPSSSPAAETAEIPPSYLGLVLSQLPLELGAQDDLRLMVELPLLRDEAEEEQVSFSEVVGCYIGHESQEVWLLARPAEEFADGLLPA